MKLSVIIVNYKSEFYLQKCIESLYENISKDLAFEIIVVNNEQKKLVLDLNHPNEFKIINNSENQGFGKGNNTGASKAKGEYLFFLNPDTLLENDTPSQLIEQLIKNRDIGIIGPKIIEFNKKRPQPWTCGKRSTLWSILFRNTINKPWNKKTKQEVDWVSGTALLIKKELFEKIGGFDENIFMYFEDQDLCLQARKLGEKALFYPSSHIIHFDGKSWSNNSQKKRAFYEAQTYFFKKHSAPIETLLLCFLRKLTKGG